MKHLKLFEDYHFSKEQIKNMLLKAQKNSEIDMKIGVDDLLNKLKEPSTLMFGFEPFVEDEARFISEGDKKRIREYITKFKELGLNTTKIESMLPDFDKYQHIQYNKIDNTTNDKKLTKLYDKLDKLEPIMTDFYNEVKRLAIEAKKIINDN